MHITDLRVVVAWLVGGDSHASVIRTQRTGVTFALNHFFSFVDISLRAQGDENDANRHGANKTLVR